MSGCQYNFRYTQLWQEWHRDWKLCQRKHQWPWKISCRNVALDCQPRVFSSWKELEPSMRSNSHYKPALLDGSSLHHGKVTSKSSLQPTLSYLCGTELNYFMNSEYSPKAFTLSFRMFHFFNYLALLHKLHYSWDVLLIRSSYTGCSCMKIILRNFIPVIWKAPTRSTKRVKVWTNLYFEAIKVREYLKIVALNNTFAKTAASC